MPILGVSSLWSVFDLDVFSLWSVSDLGVSSLWPVYNLAISSLWWRVSKKVKASSEKHWKTFNHI